MGSLKFLEILHYLLDPKVGPMGTGFILAVQISSEPIPGKYYKLLGKRVTLDLDNLVVQDKYGRNVAVVCLCNANGSAGDDFNRLIVDAKYAELNDYKDNEFDPAIWWSEPEQTDTESSEKKYVGSKESNKYHYPECRWAKKILPENAIWFSSSEDARSKGYVPCGVCHPLQNSKLRVNAPRPKGRGFYRFCEQTASPV